MAGVGALISTAAIITAAPIRTNADALVRPALPQSIGIETHWNDRWLLCEAGSQSEGRNANSQSPKLEHVFAHEVEVRKTTHEKNEKKNSWEFGIRQFNPRTQTDFNLLHFEAGASGC